MNGVNHSLCWVIWLLWSSASAALVLSSDVWQRSYLAEIQKRGQCSEQPLEEETLSNCLSGTWSCRMAGQFWWSPTLLHGSEKTLVLIATEILLFTFLFYYFVSFTGDPKAPLLLYIPLAHFFKQFSDIKHLNERCSSQLTVIVYNGDFLYLHCSNV